jgi:hypothetical protein
MASERSRRMIDMGHTEAQRKGKGQVEHDLASLAKPTTRLFAVTGLPWSGDHFLFFLGTSTQAQSTG